MTTTIELTIDVNYLYRPRVPARDYGRQEDAIPPEPAHIKIVEVIANNVDILSALTQHQVHQLEDDCLEHAKNL